MVTFGGYIGLTSFLPTLFHDGYGIDKQAVGKYAAGAIIAASALRVVGGWLSDRVGGARVLPGLFAVVVVAIGAAATIPSSPIVMACLMIVAFAALGAGNGAVFQLVPLRFTAATAVASSLIGEIGALAGGLLPNAMGAGKQWTGSYSIGFLGLAALAIVASVLILRVMPTWNRTWARSASTAPSTDAVGDQIAEAA
jgi:NNP family nitrate/nitrite transporter-like MFS transporter